MNGKRLHQGWVPVNGRYVPVALAVTILLAGWCEETGAASADPGGRETTSQQLLSVAACLATEGFRVEVGTCGAFDVVAGESRWRIQSAFSQSGAKIRWNTLGRAKEEADPAWQPAVEVVGKRKAVIRASSGSYALERSLVIEGERICVTDTLKSLAPDDVGVLVRNAIRPSGAPEQVLLGGVPTTHAGNIPENPTVFIMCPKGSIGCAAEDTLSRVQFEGFSSGGEAGWSLDHLALRPAVSWTFRWTIYPLAPGRDYFDFINCVRRDWVSNYAIDGPFDFGPPPEICEDPVRLKAYLSRKRLKIAAPGHWLDYDNFDSSKGRLETRAEYKERMQRVRSALKAADPEIRVVGNMEGPLVSVSVPLSRRLWDILPQEERGQYYPKLFTESQIALMGEMPILQKDSLVYGPEGRPYYELYYRGLKDNRTPLVAILVYPAPGNGQMAFWMDQARFLMEEVGLDGIYLDGGGPVSGARYGYDKWDGVTVDMDPATGRIIRRYTDYMRIIGDAPCRDLFDYVLSRGGTLVANGHHYTEELQRYAIARILETGGAYDPLEIGEGEKPPFVGGMCKGHLDSPVALGIHPPNLGDKGTANYARAVMKSVITHLRHGLLYYYYNAEIPETGPGSGEYGPINHMFPITPVELHEGWIVGKERVISARSIDVLWRKNAHPVVHVFDVFGRPLPGTARAKIERAGEDEWRISLSLQDWEEIAVVE